MSVIALLWMMTCCLTATADSPTSNLSIPALKSNTSVKYASVEQQHNQIKLRGQTNDFNETLDSIACPGGDFCPPGSLCCQTLICCPDHDYKKPETKEQDRLSWAEIILHASLPILFLLVMSLVVCLTWSSCPLYDCVQFNKKYTKDDAGCAELMGQLPVYMRVMPTEESPLGNILILNSSLLDDEGFDRISNADHDALI